MWCLRPAWCTCTEAELKLNELQTCSHAVHWQWRLVRTYPTTAASCMKCSIFRVSELLILA